MRRAAGTLIGAIIVSAMVAAFAGCDDEVASLPAKRTAHSSSSGTSGGSDPSTQSADVPDPNNNGGDDGSSGDDPNGGDGTTNPPAPVDAGPPVDAAPPITAFSDTSPYQLITPPKQSQDHHEGNSNAGKDCLLCHTGQGAPQFVIAGTVFSTKGSNTGASGVQVRIVSATGDEIALVGTDASGNFWLKGTTALPTGAHVGVRDATNTKLMTGSPSASCNNSNCHVSKQPPIFLSN